MPLVIALYAYRDARVGLKAVAQGCEVAFYGGNHIGHRHPHVGGRYQGRCSEPVYALSHVAVGGLDGVMAREQEARRESRFWTHPRFARGAEQGHAHAHIEAQPLPGLHLVFEPQGGLGEVVASAAYERVDVDPCVVVHLVVVLSQGSVRVERVEAIGAMLVHLYRGVVALVAGRDASPHAVPLEHASHYLKFCLPLIDVAVLRGAALLIGHGQVAQLVVVVHVVGCSARHLIAVGAVVRTGVEGDIVVELQVPVDAQQQVAPVVAVFRIALERHCGFVLHCVFSARAAVGGGRLAVAPPVDHGRELGVVAQVVSHPGCEVEIVELGVRPKACRLVIYLVEHRLGEQIEIRRSCPQVE